MQLAAMKSKVEELGFQVTGTGRTSAEVLSSLSGRSTDVVLMDINLHEEDEGISLASHIKEDVDVPIIFVTAMDSDSIVQRAVGIAPSGYLSKPVDPAELKANIELAVRKQNPAVKNGKAKDYLTVRMGQRLEKVYFRDVSHLTVESKNYVTLIDVNARRFVVRGSLKKMLEALFPPSFLRTHHSHAMNMAYVKFIEESTQEAFLISGESIPIGKAFKKEVYERMNIA